jgi:hypothetical protein
MFRNLIANIFIGFYASGTRKGVSIDLSPPIHTDKFNIINTSNGMDYVTQSNYSYENIFPSLRSVETLNSKFNVLEKLKNECSLEHKFIHRNNIMETIKKYYNDENLGTLSYKGPHHSIAILFADW